MVYTDTIAAIATALSSSGIGIIRISGSDAVAVAERMFEPAVAGKRLSEQKTYTIHYGYIRDGEERIDEVLLLLMRGPHSYTAENTVEIDCHGGVLVMKRILELAVKCGARLAEPGEFTKRAFLNGRIREYCKKEQETLWDESRRLVNPHEIHVDLSNELWHMKAQLLDSYHYTSN